MCILWRNFLFFVFFLSKEHWEKLFPRSRVVTKFLHSQPTLIVSSPLSFNGRREWERALRAEKHRVLSRTKTPIQPTRPKWKLQKAHALVWILHSHRKRERAHIKTKTQRADKLWTGGEQVSSFGVSQSGGGIVLGMYCGCLCVCTPTCVIPSPRSLFINLIHQQRAVVRVTRPRLSLANP